MHDVEVIESPTAAISALDPIRARLLAELAEPQSAAMLAARVGIPRQKVNYHLRRLEAHGLVALHEERAHGGITERVLAATARSYVLDPGAEAPHGDRLSARYLIAVAARVVREVGRLARRGPVATLAIDTRIGFATPQDRAAFADELTAAVTSLAAKYHHDDGRPHRLVVAAHPLPEEDASHDT
jgi:DNA-binding transcriptional ArsR family regulator